MRCSACPSAPGQTVVTYTATVVPSRLSSHCQHWQFARKKEKQGGTNTSGTLEIKARRLVLAVRYHSKIGQLRGTGSGSSPH